MPSGNSKAKAMALPPLETDGEKPPGRKTNIFTDIQETPTETEILRSLGNDIVKVRNKKDVLTFIRPKLKLLFNTDDIFICFLDTLNETLNPILRVGGANRTNHPEYDRIVNYNYPIHDGFIDKILDSSEPIVVDIAELSDANDCIKFFRTTGLVQTLSIRLINAGEVIGILTLWSETKKFFTARYKQLISEIANQISLVVINILANEEITNRENEKSILLSLSGEIASLKDRNDLFQVVNARIKKLFGITQFGIAQINEDRVTHSAFIMDLGEHVSREIDFKEITSLKYSITDTAFSSIVASNDPVTLNVDELGKEKDAPPYVKFWQAVGFKQLLCLALCVGGDPIGVIFFNIRPNEINNLKTNLLKGVCAQLAVAVSNILAHEKLIEQLHEINKYKQQLENEKIYLKEEIEHSHNYSEIIGESSEIKKVFKLVTQVAYSDSTVLILGETGTGKELIARAIHNSSTRKNKLMVKVNCAALPANLIESELFGHERGSFTGAIERRIGKFELANNGTLFLDEIGEMPLELQVKLLRALQEKEIERVGGKTTIKTDVRIIAATNRNLEKLMDEGMFRSDLYYRLNIFPITLPSLRDRREDIPPLVSYFIVRYSKKAGKKINTINTKALQELSEYDWPGNIRELEHLIERSVLLATGDTIKEIHLPQQKRNLKPVPDKEDITIRTIDEHEKEYILKVLKHVKGRIGGVGGAAELLGVPTSTLNSKIKRLGIRKVHL